MCVSIPLDDWRRESDSDTGAYAATRRISGNPQVPQADIDRVAQISENAANPVLVLGPDVDEYGGWEAAIALAEKLRTEVYLGSGEYSRMPFPPITAVSVGRSARRWPRSASD
ncbi:hypothetical protein GPX89_42560 [Nocardia sp. ET3-3]|uniref:Thiamine pyrophosphate enzyme central domain-containing protein n=1 Tax=Nocardia terrae TaxID=2675851 RepID=A0A7K1VBP5_9NOCA|nr:hypothetical protein [Nocardia terrae]MVU83899.1 hypothetical protein [Nocardia terrae]